MVSLEESELVWLAGDGLVMEEKFERKRSEREGLMGKLGSLLI